jgi:drug/metabolite transporter (DMT)-like permease
MITVAALALAAAFLFALSAFLQQRAARAVVGADTASLRDAAGVKRLLGRLLRSRMWLIGWLTNLCGVGAQAGALKVGSVAAVQPFMAAQLLFVLLLASGEQRRWPSVRDWFSALAVCAGLVLFLTAGASPLTGEPHRHRVLLATACMVGLVVMLRQVSRHTFPWLAGLLVGVAAGLCHALNAVYLKLTVEDLVHGGALATLFDWPVYATAVTALSGMMLVQIAFASGPLPPAVAAMSVTNPVASFALGILAFDAPAPRDPAVLSAIAVSGVLIAVGIVGLANASNTRQLYGNEQLQHVGDAAEANVRRRAVLRLR